MPPIYLGYTGSRRDVLGYLNAARSLRRLLNELEPDIVHSHLWPAARLVARASGGRHPNVVHIQDTRDWLVGKSWRQRLTRLSTRLALQRNPPQYVAVSRAARDYTTKNLPWIDCEIPVVYNGFDEREFSSARIEARTGTRSGLTIGTAGRFSFEKGHLHLFAAMAKVVRDNPQVSLRIAGSGPLASNYKKSIRDLGLSDNVELCGHVAEMSSFYRSLDMFVLPSLGMEGLPLTILEAMRHGLPIIATKVAGTEEVIRHGYEGLIVRPGDAFELASAIVRLTCDTALRQRMGNSASRRVSAYFSGRRMAQECAAVYRRILFRE